MLQVQPETRASLLHVCVAQLRGAGTEKKSVYIKGGCLRMIVSEKLTSSFFIFFDSGGAPPGELPLLLLPPWESPPPTEPEELAAGLLEPPDPATTTDDLGGDSEVRCKKDEKKPGG